jgi:hypothetical protein
METGKFRGNNAHNQQKSNLFQYTRLPYPFLILENIPL